MEAASALPLPTGKGLDAVPDAHREVGRIGSLTRLDNLFDPTSPIRGSLFPPGQSPRFSPHTPMDARLIGDRDWVLVQASTGLWLHEAKTLARRGRVAPPPIAAMAVVSDRKAFAFVTCDERCDLFVVRFPSLDTIRRESVDKPARIRFSDDGSRIVVATESEEEIQVVDVAHGGVTRIDHGEDINDATFLGPRSDYVAVADDGDNAVVYDVRDKRQSFSSAPLVTAFIRDHAADPALAPLITPQRDQNAVAYDAATDTLYTGGDDNRVWRFRPMLGGKPQLISPPWKLDANIEEIAIDGGRVWVGTDALTLQLFDAAGNAESKLGSLSTVDVVSWHVRVGAGLHGDALAVMESLLVRWDPTTHLSLVAGGFVDSRQWLASELEEDTALVGCVPGSGAWTCHVHRVEHGAPAVDAETVPLGQVELGNLASWSELGKVRVLAGPSLGDSLRMAYLMPGGKLGEAKDTRAAAGGRFAIRPDQKSAGYVAPDGRVYEFTVGDHELVEVSRLRAPAPTDSLEWDVATKQWKLVSPFDR